MSTYLLSDDNAWTSPKNVKKKNNDVSWKDAVGNEYVVPGNKTVYQLALVGYGSSIAYYINALRQRSASIEDFDWSRVVILGKQDAWEATVRGEGFINHELHNIAQWSDKVPKYVQEYLPRGKWVEQNKSVLDWAINKGAVHIESHLQKVSRNGDLFQLDYGQTLLAAKVILGMGAGPHFTFPNDRYVPQPAENVKHDVQKMQFLAERVVTLDRFMCTHGAGKDGSQKVDVKVIIQGANAGIDAVQRAWEHGYSVYLFRSDEPAWLTGNRLDVSPSKSRLLLDIPDDDEELYAEEVTVSASNGDKVIVSPSQDGDKLQVEIKFAQQSNQQSTYEVDYYVPALGQNPVATGAIGDVLKQGGLAWDDLEPIYDRDQIFGLPYQTALGIQVKGTTYGRGLQIIGAAAESLAGARPSEARELKGNQQKSAESVQHNYREQFSVDGKSAQLLEQHFQEAEAYLKKVRLGVMLQHQVDPAKMPKVKEVDFPVKVPEWLATEDNPAATAVASVLAAAQLGAVRAAAAALHNMIPDHIVNGSQANYTTDDRTMLAVYIASEFSHIPPKVADVIVEQIVKSRRQAWNKPQKKAPLPSTRIGYDDKQSEQITTWLRQENHAWFVELTDMKTMKPKPNRDKLWVESDTPKVFQAEQ